MYGSNKCFYTLSTMCISQYLTVRYAQCHVGVASLQSFSALVCAKPAEQLAMLFRVSGVWARVGASSNVCTGIHHLK